MPRSRLSPHDRYFRSMMCDPQVNREFFEAHLPQEIKQSIDFDSIALQKESYIGDKLRLQTVDLLYTVNFEGERGYIYLLLEHASTPNPWLPLRMLKYIIAIMEEHIAKTNAEELPFVYPMVFYTGNRAFNHSMDLFDLFGTPRRKALAKETLTQCRLIDLSQASDEELEKYRWFGTAALTMKHIYDSDIIPFLEGFLKLLSIIEKMGKTDYIYRVVSYIIEAGQVSDKNKFIELLKAGLESTNEEEIMRIIDHFKPDIYERGKQQAWLEFEQLKPELFNKAKQEAKDETLHDVALKLLRLKKNVEEISEVTGFSAQEIEALKIQIN